MDRIRDLTGVDSREDELLRGTSSGFFDGAVLGGDPPVAHLEDDDTVWYALRNKKAGVDVSGDPRRDGASPDGAHQALLVVTDCRLLFLVGRAGGDWVESVPMEELLEASDRNSGLLTNTLAVETVEGATWRFPCRGDVSEVATKITDAAQTWANASRLADEASDRITASRDHLDDGEFDAARDTLEGAAGKIALALERVETLGDGARRRLERRTERIEDRLQALRREIAAMEGGHHHAAAQRAWKADHDFERAAREYEAAVAAYRRAMDEKGTTPSQESLRSRLRGAAGEREVLRVAPTADADAAREIATETDDADEAAAEWETALTCYREAVSLDWGSADRSFVIDRERARDRADEASERAIDARVEASEEWIAAGDRIARNDRRQEARGAYERAQEHLETGLEIARELRPGRVETIERRLSDLDRRKAGDVPDPDDTGAERSTTTATGVPVAGSGETSEATPATRRIETGAAAGTDDASADGPPVDELKAAVEDLGAGELREVVADVWERDGWSTTAFSATTDAVYDIVALRAGGGETERLLLWTVDHREEGTVGETAVRQCATTLESSQGADRATLVTTGTVTTAARERAEELGVTVVDGEALAANVRNAGLADRLDPADAQP